MGGIRTSYREELHRELIRAAAEIADNEGLEALTIKRLAADFGSSIGTIYRLVTSKAHLVAEVQAVQLAALAAAARANDDDCGARIDTVPSPIEARAVARVWAAGHFWIDAAMRSPLVIRHARRLISDPEIDSDERERAVGATLEPLRSALDRAVALGALDPGHTRSRAALVASIVPLPTCAPHLWRAEDADTALSIHLLASLLSQWGAAPGLLDEATDLVGIHP